MKSNVSNNEPKFNGLREQEFVIAHKSMHLISTSFDLGSVWLILNAFSCMFPRVG